MYRDVLEQIPLLIDVCSLVIIADQTQVNSACLCTIRELHLSADMVVLFLGCLVGSFERIWTTVSGGLHQLGCVLCYGSTSWHLTCSGG